MRSFLKVKVNGLAHEQRILRKYLNSLRKRAGKRSAGPGDGAQYTPNERKAFDGMYRHSKDELGPELRHSNLANGFLKKRPYTAMEMYCRKIPDWDRVERMVMKFGIDDPRNLRQSFAAWKDASASHAEQRRKDLLEKDVLSARKRKERYTANNTDDARASRRLHHGKDAES